MSAVVYLRGRGWFPGSNSPKREKKSYLMFNKYFTTGFLIIRPLTPPHPKEIIENTPLYVCILDMYIDHLINQLIVIVHNCEDGII